MDFGKALEAAKLGKKIFREGWNGKGMFVFMGFPRVEVNAEVGGQFTSMDSAAVFSCDYSGPVLCMKSAQNTIVVGWLASQTDMLAEDWCIL